MKRLRLRPTRGTKIAGGLAALPALALSGAALAAGGEGRFGTLAVAKIPQITGGSGSITSFNLKIEKSVDGINPISAKCSDGKLKVHVEGKFEDGTRAQTEVVRACTPKS